jgi:hypothetical protein
VIRYKRGVAQEKGTSDNADRSRLVVLGSLLDTTVRRVTYFFLLRTDWKPQSNAVVSPDHVCCICHLQWSANNSTYELTATIPEGSMGRLKLRTPAGANRLVRGFHMA